MNKKITQYDLAQILNVSRSTVSLALADSPRIKKATKGKVRKLAARMNYRPSMLARNMVLKKSFSVGIISPPFSQPFHAELASQIHSLLNKRNYAGIFSPVNGSDEQSEAVEFLLSREVDGVIVTTELGKDIQKKLRRENATVVFYTKPELEFDYVSVDIYKAGYMAVEHLVSRGHNKIGFIGLASEKEDARFAGYKDALSRHNLLFNNNWVITALMDAPNNFKQGFEAMNKILTFADRPSAVFARNDAFAIGAIRAVGEKGLGVPGDMAVIGFDNIRESEFSTPPLTTILCPKDVIASELVRAVMNRIEQKNSNLPYEEVIIEPELIVRKSCGIGEWAVTMRSLANGRGESGRKRQKSFQGNGFLHGGSKP